MPLVSVVIPVYNAEKYILATLESIQAQSFSDFDVSVVDDCSTDSSSAIIKQFCSQNARFTYRCAPHNFGGPAGPRNIGVSTSTGALIAFCDADDIWVSHKLEIQVAVMNETGAALVCAAIRDFTNDSLLPIFHPPTLPIEYCDIRHARLLLKNWIAMSSVLIKRSTLVAAGPFNIETSHVAVEDFDMWLRVSGSEGRIVRIAAPLVHYRKVPTSISASKSMMIRKALNVIGEDYARRGKRRLFDIIRPIHWLLYVSTSGWMRAIRREL